jgi:hypothetical protein
MLLDAGADPTKALDRIVAEHVMRGAGDVEFGPKRDHYIALHLMLEAAGKTIDDYAFDARCKEEYAKHMAPMLACEAACVAFLGIHKFRDAHLFEQIPRELVAQMARVIWAERWEQ